MNFDVEFLGIKDPGDLAKERVEMRATAPFLIGAFALFCAAKASDGDEISSYLKTAFWFPDAAVNKGDLVVVYSGSGDDTAKKEADGHTTHTFYWERTAPVWNAPFVPVLVMIYDWRVLKVQSELQALTEASS